MVVGNIQHLTLNIQHFPSNIQHLTLNILQKESFCLPKRILLLSKTSPFTCKKEPFCSAKGLLLKYGCCRMLYPDVLTLFLFLNILGLGQHQIEHYAYYCGESDARYCERTR